MKGHGELKGFLALILVAGIVLVPRYVYSQDILAPGGDAVGFAGHVGQDVVFLVDTENRSTHRS
jgi:hypothetical protein